MSVPEPAPVAVVVGADPDDTVLRLKVATDLRGAGIAARAELGRRKLGKQLEAAVKAGAGWAVIVGEELADGHVGLKDLGSGEQDTVLLDEVGAAISG
jgi:histidyl-tRNA synthetase